MNCRVKERIRSGGGGVTLGSPVGVKSMQRTQFPGLRTDGLGHTDRDIEEPASCIKVTRGATLTTQHYHSGLPAGFGTSESGPPVRDLFFVGTRNSQHVVLGGGAVPPAPSIGHPQTDGTYLPRVVRVHDSCGKPLSRYSLTVDANYLLCSELVAVSLLWSLMLRKRKAGDLLRWDVATVSNTRVDNVRYIIKAGPIE